MGLPIPASACVGEAGFELAALGFELAALGLDVGVGPVVPEQVADGGGAAPQGAYRGASDGPAGLGVDAADGDMDMPAVRVGVGGADRVVAVVEAEIASCSPT